MQKSDIPSRTARHILRDLERDNHHQLPEQNRATFMADLNLAVSDPSLATVEHLATQFEDNVLLKDYIFGQRKGTLRRLETSEVNDFDHESAIGSKRTDYGWAFNDGIRNLW